jgi:hypothetical protein
MKSMLEKKLTLKIVLILLILGGILAYGIYVGKLGFYWDEWPFLWFNHAFGASGVLKYFSHNRPFWGYIYAFTLPVLGTNIIYWQIFGLVFRCLSGLSLWWSLSQIWQDRKWEAAASALIFILYPSFTQQSIALMYGHFFVILTSFFLSIGLMVKAIRQPRWCWIFLLAGLITSAINLFCMEYFFGLELLRPLVLFIVLAEFQKLFLHRILETIKHWLPFLLLTILYIYWRIIVFKFPTYQPKVIDAADPITSLFSLFLTELEYIKTVTLDVWIRLFHPPIPPGFGLRSILVYWTLVVISFIVITAFFLVFKPIEENSSRHPWSGFVLLSIPALLLAGIPFLVTLLKVGLDFPADRFSLPFMLGGSLFFVGLVMFVPVKYPIKSIFIALFACLSIGLQFTYSSQFQQDWKIQKDFFWQLFWRAPVIEPKTMILTEYLPHYFESDNSLTAAMNWTYAPDFSSGDLPYLVNFISVRTETGILTLSPNMPVHQNYKVADFNGSTSNSLVLYYKPPGCLRILDPQRDSNFPMLPKLLKEALPLSKPGLIISEGNNKIHPLEFLGNEPEHGWCYFYEKAELARYKGDWEQVALLGDQALASGDYPNEPSERIVFIEGYAHNGLWQKAKELTFQSYKVNPQLSKMLCTSWGMIKQSTPMDQAGIKVFENISTQLECTN